MYIISNIAIVKLVMIVEQCMLFMWGFFYNKLCFIVDILCVVTCIYFKCLCTLFISNIVHSNAGNDCRTMHVVYVLFFFTTSFVLSFMSFMPFVLSILLTPRLEVDSLKGCVCVCMAFLKRHTGLNVRKTAAYVMIKQCVCTYKNDAYVSAYVKTDSNKL